MFNFFSRTLRFFALDCVLVHVFCQLPCKWFFSLVSVCVYDLVHLFWRWPSRFSFFPSFIAFVHRYFFPVDLLGMDALCTQHETLNSLNGTSKSILLLSAIFRKMMNHIQSRIFNLHPARNTKELHVVVVTHLTLFCFHQASRWRERSLGTPPLFRSCLGAFLTSFPLCSDARLSYIGESFSIVCYSSSWARKIMMKWASW